MLALGIRYLNGFVAASRSDDYARPEWPPHPGRVFMALAAAHFETGQDQAEREALLWLEQQTPPAIAAGTAIDRTAVTHYVPVNDKAGPSKAVLQSIPVPRDRQPRTFAQAWLERDTAYLAWIDAEPGAAIREALQGLCAKVARLGHSSSLVQMWLAESAKEIPTPAWLPDEQTPQVQMRIAAPGTLNELARRYNAGAVETYASLLVSAADESDPKVQKAAKIRIKREFEGGPPSRLRPRLSVHAGYTPPAAPDPNASVARGVFSSNLIVLALSAEESPYRHLDLLSVLQLSQRWRDALISQNNDLSGIARAIVSGHESDGAPLQAPHLALLPLAFVGHRHADGRLLGVAMALPAALSPDDRRGVLAAIGCVRRLALGRMGVWRVESDSAGRPQWNLRPETWTASPSGATHWSTVTPVVYDHHPKTRDKAAYQQEVALMIATACTRIGLPEPREVIPTPVSAHLGTPPAHAFPRLHRKDESERRHVHAILVFDRPVVGPVVVGAGRYLGYGFCRPLDESGEREGS